MDSNKNSDLVMERCDTYEDHPKFSVLPLRNGVDSEKNFDLVTVGMIKSTPSVLHRVRRIGSWLV